MQHKNNFVCRRSCCSPCEFSAWFLPLKFGWIGGDGYEKRLLTEKDFAELTSRKIYLIVVVSEHLVMVYVELNNTFSSTN